MEDLWGKIESWLSEHAPSVSKALNPGATDRQLDVAEAILCVSFPADFRECYLIHNGTALRGACLFPGGEFLSLDRIVQEWTVWKELVDEGAFRGDESEPDRGIHDDWFNVRWIPFTYDGAGNHYCLDLAPSAWGTNGQIITMWHDAPERELIAAGFRDYLELILEKLHSGEYVYSSEYDGIVPIDEVS